MSQSALLLLCALAQSPYFPTPEAPPPPPPPAAATPSEVKREAPAAAAPAEPEVHTLEAVLAGTGGLVLPGLGSYVRGDVGGGVFHTFVGMQALGFFVPAFYDILGDDDWDDSPRRGVALVSAAALYALNYFASIARAGRPVPTTGTPRDALRVRVGVSTLIGARAEEIGDYDVDVVVSPAQQLSLGLMLGSVVELSLFGQSFFGDFYWPGPKKKEYGLTAGGGLTAYVPTGTRVSPYLGAFAAFHPNSPIFGGRVGLAVALSPRVDLIVGGQMGTDTADDPTVSHASFELGVVHAF